MNIATLIRTLRLDDAPSDNVPVDASKDIGRTYQPHVMGHCSACDADNVEITIGRDLAVPITLRCPVCGMIYRYKEGAWLSVTAERFLIGRR